MKLMVINANTTEAITAKVARVASAAVSNGTEILPVTATFGAPIISTRTENAIAAHAALSAAAAHQRECDGALLAVSLDSGLAAIREMLPIPVVGMTEAATLIACTLGAHFGVVTFGKRTIPIYRELVLAYGLGHRLAGIRAADIPTQAYGDLAAVRDETLNLARGLIEEQGAETIILAGVAMAGWSDDLQAELPVPVLDGIRCGIQLVELLVRLRTKKPTVGSFSLPVARELINLDANLAPMSTLSPRTSR